MIQVSNHSVVYQDGALRPADAAEKTAGQARTMAYGIFARHNTSGDMASLQLKMDAMASHDITYVGIIQTARASGLQQFPLPYVLTNCHNSLCAVGGTINEDDHVFGLSAARKYGGEFVPAHQAVIHSYMRECYAGCGKMILGSDSHTRYGAFGTLAFGEGGPELVKQLLNRTYDIAYPKVIAVYLTGKPRPGVGPQDVALDLIRTVFTPGTVKNAVLEFFGPGVANLSMDYRCGIDVMTTETACLSSVWCTDDTTRRCLEELGRGDQYAPMAPADGAWYDNLVEIALDEVEPMIALPFHPSNAYTIREFKANAAELLHGVDEATRAQFELKNPPAPLTEKLRDGEFYVDQAVIAGCSGGTWQNLMRTAEILKGESIRDMAFGLSVYPASQPTFLDLAKNGALADLTAAGATIRSCFCGPCFGAGDVPANGGFSIRHSTRNFPNREGSKPGNGQIAYVALMDARSIAATARNGGRLTAATELDFIPEDRPDELYHFDDAVYRNRIYHGVGKPQPETELVFGPNIADWPEQVPLPENLVLTVCSAIYDAVTTTDELIPSGETSSYRSNPLGLAEFTLSRKDPAYVGRAKEIKALELKRRAGEIDDAVTAALRGFDPADTGLGSLVMALRPGDGSAREQAASCQRVLGGVANIALEYATKRYRSNVVNWGMLPFISADLESLGIAPGDQVVLRGIRSALEAKADSVDALLVQNGAEKAITLRLPNMADEERDIILSGCLINYYAGK
ncbi:MAG: hydratase [Oscillospiraceae bacterium]|nr:hydratase [Oscillospiraceae bacterium]